MRDRLSCGKGNGPACPHHPALPLGIFPCPPPSPWESAIGNGESGRKTSPHRTPPPFFHRRLTPPHHSPFPRFPISDCRFPRGRWRWGGARRGAATFAPARDVPASALLLTWHRALKYES